MFRPYHRQGSASAKRQRLCPRLFVEQLEERCLLSNTLAPADSNLLTVAQVPNDTRFSEQWALLNTGQAGGKAGDDIHATQAWDVTKGSRKVVVSVMDTGIDYNHPDLYQNIWLNQAEIPLSRKANLIDVDGDGLITFADLNDLRNQGAFKITDVNGDGRIDPGDILAPMVRDASGNDQGQGGWAFPGNTLDGDTAHPNDFIGWNFVNNTNNPFDDFGHGTNVAGVIGAMSNNSTGVAGVAWQVSLMPVKFMDSSGRGTVSQFIAALNYTVAHGVKISNNSWTGGGNDPSLLAAIQNARLQGQIFVAAAGNSGLNIDQTPTYPASFALDNIVAVAATDRSDLLTSYSNYGATSVDLGAPGQAILTTTRNSSYTVASGTSLAVPFVAGAFALVWGQHPNWTYTQVINQVLKTVDPLPSLKGKTVTGGRLDLAAAVGSVITQTVTPATVVSCTFSGTSPGSINMIQVVFSKQMEVGSFTTTQVQLLGPDGKVIPVTSIKVVDAPANRTFNILFPSQTAPGIYTLTLGPNIKDPTGLRMQPFSTTYTLVPVSPSHSTTTASVEDGGNPPMLPGQTTGSLPTGNRVNLVGMLWQWSEVRTLNNWVLASTPVQPVSVIWQPARVSGQEEEPVRASRMGAATETGPVGTSNGIKGENQLVMDVLLTWMGEQAALEENPAEV